MTRKIPLGRFLAQNPFPHPYTDGLFYREKMRAIHRVAPDQTPPSILDIGGGRSGLCSLLYPGSTVITLDPDIGCAGRGPAAGHARFVCGDGCALPFADETFDLVTLFDVLEHVVDHRTLAAQALRVLKPDGCILISTPASVWRYPYYSLMRRYCPPEQELMQCWGHVRRGYSLNDIHRLFGRESNRTATFINPLTAFFHDLAFSRLSRRQRLFWYLLSAIPTWAAYALHTPATPGNEIAVRLRKAPD